VRLGVSRVRVAGCFQEQNDQCGNSTAQSQALDDGCINVRNMLNT